MGKLHHMNLEIYITPPLQINQFMNGGSQKAVTNLKP